MYKVAFFPTPAPSPAERFPQRGAEAELVGPRVGRLPGEHFGRHVRGGTHLGAGPGEGRGAVAHRRQPGRGRGGRRVALKQALQKTLHLFFFVRFFF